MRKIRHKFWMFFEDTHRFYKHILHINNGNNAQKHYLPIKLLLNLLAAFCVEKTRFLSIFFSNSEFRMRVYRGKIEPRNEGIPLYAFFRIFPQKINILKKIKLGFIELNKVYEVHVKTTLLNIMNIW